MGLLNQNFLLADKLGEIWVIHNMSVDSLTDIQSGSALQGPGDTSLWLLKSSQNKLSSNRNSYFIKYDIGQVPCNTVKLFLHMHSWLLYFWRIRSGRVPTCITQQEKFDFPPAYGKTQRKNDMTQNVHRRNWISFVQRASAEQVTWLETMHYVYKSGF